MIKNSVGFAYFIGIVGAISWGISFIGTKTSLDYLEPIQVMSARMSIALMTFVMLIGIGAVKVDFTNKNIKGLILLSFAQPCLYSIFEIIGIDLTTASESAIILSVVPVVVTLIYIIGFKERVKNATIGFILLSFGGVVMTAISDISASGKVLGYMSLFAAVFFAATYTVLSKSLSKEFTPIEITFVMTLSGFVFFNCLNLIMGYKISSYTTIFKHNQLLLSIVFLGVVCSVFAFIAYNHLINKVPAYKASTVSLSILTVTGVIAGVIIRNDPITIYKLFGLVMILIGIIGASQPDKREL